MNIANKITTIRMFMIPIFVIVVLITGLESLLPGILFIVAALTDFVDGYLARSRNLVTNFGKFMDPLADKLLSTTALIMLIQLEKISAWIVVIIVAREFIITGFRVLAASNNITIAASIWGKFKTTTQFIAIILLLFKDTLLLNFVFPLDTIFVYLSLVLTIISAADYIIKNKNVLDLSNI